MRLDTETTLKEKIYKILKTVNKPSRYIGQEIGSITKDWDKTDLKVCLLFPDMYEVAVSNLGHRILYELINKAKSKFDFAGDRTYAPEPDLKNKLKENNIPLYGVDYFRPLSEYDVLAVSLQYELSYPTILAMLEMGNIPIKNVERTESSPIIIAGGPGSYNPEPLTDFIDAFIIGDGEDILIEILDAITKQKAENRSRIEILQTLANIEGVYVPMFYNAAEDFCKPTPNSTYVLSTIKKRVAQFDDKAFPVDFPVPYSPSVHDRAVVEIRRGCGRMCRFCQPCYVNLPVRERQPEGIIDLVECSLKNTGYDEYSLLSLSSNDYKGVENLVSVLNQKHALSKASISLPSQRADTFSIELANQVQSVRKSTLTFAAEAGSQRLRDAINKNLTEEQIFDAIISAYKSGWFGIKLYFMIGLPTETYEDLDEIINLLIRLKQKALLTKKELNISRHLELTCTVSIFVPKPFTPFQWFGQNNKEEINNKISYLRDKIRYVKGVKLNFHDSFLCQLEAVFTRGDRKLNKIIETAWKKGSYLDAWNEHFNKNLWIEASEETGISFEEYATRNISTEKELPWDFVDTGVNKSWLVEEYNKAIISTTSPPCDVKCTNCGVCTNLNVKKSINTGLNIENVQVQIKEKPDNDEEVQKQQQIPTYKYRLKISKLNHLKFISHLDWLGLIYKAVRKSQINVAFTQGFNPSPKIAVGIALPLFIESDGEYVDIELYDKLDSNELKEKINNNLPASSKISKAVEITSKSLSLDDHVNWALYIATTEKNCLLKNYDLAGNINHVLSKETIWVEKTTKKGLKKQIDVRPSIHSITLSENEKNYNLEFILKTGHNDQNNPGISSLRADNFLKEITPEIEWDIKRLKLLDRDLKELL